MVLSEKSCLLTIIGLLLLLVGPQSVAARSDLLFVPDDIDVKPNTPPLSKQSASSKTRPALSEQEAGNTLGSNHRFELSCDSQVISKLHNGTRSQSDEHEEYIIDMAAKTWRRIGQDVNVLGYNDDDLILADHSDDDAGDHFSINRKTGELSRVARFHSDIFLVTGVCAKTHANPKNKF